VILPVETGRSTIMPRFRLSSQLAQLERNLYRLPGTESSNTEKEYAADKVSAPSEDEIPVENVVIAEAVNRRCEVEAAAEHILRLCRERGYRFGDMAVILRDFTDYQELIEAVFEDYCIAYFMDQRRSVRLTVYDIRGGRVAILADRAFDPGYHEVGWDGKNDEGRTVSSGVYFVRMETDNYQAVQRAVMIR